MRSGRVARTQRRRRVGVVAARRTIAWAVALGLLLLAASSAGPVAPVEAQGGPTRPPGPPEPKPSLTWIGPDKFAGRIRSAVFDPRDVNATTIYAGAATGGVWKTTDGGTTWASLDDFMPTQVIGSLAMDPRNPDTIYAGTGEVFTFGAEGLSLRGADRGSGIFVSRDAGATWHQLAGTLTGADWRFVSRIAIDPDDSSHIFAATATGLFGSTNGGQSFQKVLDGLFLDVKFHPLRHDGVVATATDNKAFFSTNAGASWSASTLPGTLATDPNKLTRIELAPAGLVRTTAGCTTPNNLAVCGRWRALHLVRDSGGVPGGATGQMVLLDSVDGGASFSFLVAGGPAIACGTDAAGNPIIVLCSNRTYTGGLWVDPRDPQKMLVAGVALLRSTNNGQSFTKIEPSSSASDFHAIVAQPGFDGVTNDRILLGYDQGLRQLRAYDTAPNAPDLNHGLRTTQFHSAVGLPVAGSSNLVGGLQDHGVLALINGAWTALKSGDGEMATASPSFFYYGKSIGEVFRSDPNGGGSVCISRSGANVITESRNDDDCTAGAVSINCAGKTPILLDPNSADRLYVGCASLWRTQDAQAAPAAINWTRVMPAAGNFQLSAMAIPRGNADLMWVGTMLRDPGPVTPDATVVTGGQLWKTTNATCGTPQGSACASGATIPTWTQMDLGKGLPARPVTDVAIDPRNNDKVYVTYSGFASDNVWKTTDGGASFTKISTGLPPVPVWALAVHPTQDGWLYAGTDVGLFISTDDGTTWSGQRGPATVNVSDLQWRGNTTQLLMATYGRGVHELKATPNPELLPPDGAAVSGEGGCIDCAFIDSGHVANLIASDEKRLVLTADPAYPSTISVVMNTRSGFTRAATPTGSALRFFVEASTSTSATLTIELFNYLKNTYVVFKTTTVQAGTERTEAVLLSTLVGEYIGPNRELKARVTWKGSTSTPLTVGTDAAGWTITRP